MRAIVITKPGPPEVLELKEKPLPEIRPGWLRLRIRAFGLNRSEMYTRQGHSGAAVQFPRVPGIECVGTIDDPSDSGWETGQKAAALMGQMGRAYDGGYAEYALVPVNQVIPVESHLDWHELAAIPETFITAHGSLEQLQLQAGQSLLIRGATSSVGLAALTMARALGVKVMATTRNPDKATVLKDNDAQHVLIDDGQIAGAVNKLYPQGVDAVLELVGQPTLADSLICLRSGGRICQTGLLGNQWDYWVSNMPGARTDVDRVGYNSEEVTAQNSAAALQHIIHKVEQGTYRLNIFRIFGMYEIVEAHRIMEDSRACGKLVVVT